MTPPRALVRVGDAVVLAAFALVVGGAALLGGVRLAIVAWRGRRR